MTLQMIAWSRCCTSSAEKLLAPLMRMLLPALQSAVIAQRRMVASSRTRSEEEKKSRRAAREEITAAHQQFPFLPTKPTRHVYVLDAGMADEIASAVIRNRSDPSTPILEVNPGPGFVTRALLKAGARQLVLAESIKGFMPGLQALQEESGGVVRACHHLDYLTAWRHPADADCGSSQFEASMPQLFAPKQWAEGSPVSVVGVVGMEKERSLLTHLINALGHQQSLFRLGRPEWFLVLSPALYTKLLVAKMDKRPASLYSHLAIVLHLLFDIHLCAELPGWKFTPRFPEKRVQVKRNKPQVSNSHRYLLRLQPHLSQPLAHAQVPHFYVFLAQLMQKKKLRLIPKMEQLVPGSGPYLIKLKVTMMTLVGDISPQEWLTIFKAMQMWPEFQGSPLKQLLAITEDEVTEDSHGASQGQTAKQQLTEVTEDSHGASKGRKAKQQLTEVTEDSHGTSKGRKAKQQLTEDSLRGD